VDNLIAGPELKGVTIEENPEKGGPRGQVYGLGGRPLMGEDSKKKEI